MISLTEEEMDAIADRITTSIIAKRKEMWVDPETHYNDHQWIEGQKKDQEERQAYRRKVINSLTIWALFLVVGFIASAIWKSVIDALKTAGTS